MHILLVDDDPDNCLALSEVLKGEGYTVETASDGYEALEVVRKGKFDAVISDALMPRMDGFVLCRTLKEEDEYKNIPVIIVTGEYTDKSDIQFALSVGAAKVIRKTADADELLKALVQIKNSAVTKAAPPSGRIIPEEEYLKGYSTVLFRRLEAKMKELQETNRKLVEKNVQLDRERQKYHQLFMSANDGILLVSQIAATIVEVNAHAKKILGLNEKSIGQKKLNELKPFGELLLEKLSRGEPVQFESTYESGKSRIFLDISGSHVPTEENLYLIILRNVTRRKEWLERFISLDKLRALGRLSNGLVHEIRNPLNVVSVNLQYLEKNLGEESPEKNFTKAALAGVSAIEKVIRETMNFAQPQTPARSRLRLGPLISEIAGLSRTSLQKSKITLEIEKSDMQDIVLADKSQILHALLNIVQNSIESMPNGGKLQMKLEESDVEDEILLKIVDTGVGMDEDVAKLAVEPFYTTKEGATGMGLSISNRLFELNDASLVCESRPGAGTTVTVRFQREK
ncbi:MAG TPA: response regulator [Candidatus Kryptonia bacterium]